MAKNYFWIVAALALACFAPGVAAQVSSGTAFAVAPGLLITNQHVVAGCSSIEIIAADGRRTGSVVDADAQIDLALLRVSGLKGATAHLRNPRNVRLGESVMVFGFPLTGSLSSGGNFTAGLVSGLRGLRDASGELQITAPVQQGNSGGPLMDASGLVIGVVQAKLDALRSAIVTGDIPQNVNFAISLEVLADFLGKNKVPFLDGDPSPDFDTARVAELAQSFTYRVECRGTSQQVEASPTVKQGQLPPCSGSQNTVTWTNCAGEGTFPRGQRYVGEFKAGKRHGQGTNTWPSGQKYVGEWRDGMRNGQGTLTWSNGYKYVGAFKDGKRHGQGTLTTPDGAKYFGEFKDGHLSGQGTHTWLGDGKYVGEFKDGKYNGHGTMTLAGGGGAKYVGEFKDGLLHGQGTLTWPSGQKYAGEWRDGKRHGQGTDTLPDGRKYVGEFKDGWRHGQGTEYRADGTILQTGIWENDVFVGGRGAEWVEVSSDNTDTIYYANPTTIRKAGNMVKIWELYDLKTAQKSSEGTSYLSMKMQSEYDCKEERQRTLFISHYSKNMGRGEAVFSFSYTDSNINSWTPVSPGSVGEGLWKFACGKK